MYLENHLYQRLKQIKGAYKLALHHRSSLIVTAVTDDFQKLHFFWIDRYISQEFSRRQRFPIPWFLNECSCFHCIARPAPVAAFLVPMHIKFETLPSTDYNLNHLSVKPSAAMVGVGVTAPDGYDWKSKLIPEYCWGPQDGEISKIARFSQSNCF